MNMLLIPEENHVYTEYSLILRPLFQLGIAQSMSSAVVHHDPPVAHAHKRGEPPETGVMGGVPDCERLVVVSGGSIEYDLPTVAHAVDDLEMTL